MQHFLSIQLKTLRGSPFLVVLATANVTTQATTIKAIANANSTMNGASSMFSQCWMLKVNVTEPKRLRNVPRPRVKVSMVKVNCAVP